MPPGLTTPECIEKGTEEMAGQSRGYTLLGVAKTRGHPVAGMDIRVGGKDLSQCASPFPRSRALGQSSETDSYLPGRTEKKRESLSLRYIRPAPAL